MGLEEGVPGGEAAAGCGPSLTPQLLLLHGRAQCGFLNEAAFMGLQGNQAAEKGPGHQPGTKRGGAGASKAGARGAGRVILLSSGGEL